MFGQSKCIVLFTVKAEYGFFYVPAHKSDKVECLLKMKALEELGSFFRPKGNIVSSKHDCYKWSVGRKKKRFYKIVLL